MTLREMWLCVIDTIVEPTTAFKRMRERPAFGAALLVYAVAFVLSIISDPEVNAQILQYATQPFSELSMDVTIHPAVVVWFLLGISLSLLFIITWMLLFVGRAMGGTCTYSALLTAIGFTQLPSIFRVPLMVFSDMVWPPLAGFGGAVISIWGVVLVVIGVRETMQLTTWRAIAALILTTLFFVIAITVIAIIVALIGIAIAAVVLP